MTDERFVHAPWTDEQVVALNASQENLTRHPFTCGRRDLPGHNRDKGDLGVLTATTNGWICESCGYTQDWAWAFMLEPGHDFLPGPTGYIDQDDPDYGPEDHLAPKKEEP